MNFQRWLLDFKICAFINYFDWLDAELVVFTLAML